MPQAIIWNDTSLSYQQLDQEFSKFHELLSAKTDIEGTHKDFPKVAIFSENSIEWITSFLGAMSAGKTVIPIDFMSQYQDVAYILNDARPEYIFYSSKTKETLEKACLLLNDNYRPCLLNLNSHLTNKTEKTLEKFFLKFHAQNNDPALIIYTSGTTGMPKGVVLSYANLFANLDAVCREVPIFNENKPVLALLPFHHIFPLMGSILAPLYVRATIACSPSLDPADLMKTLQNNKVAIMIGVPRLYTQIFRGIKSKIDANVIAKSFFKIATTLKSKKISRLLFSSVHKKMGGNIQYLVSGGAALDQEIARGLDTLGLTVLEGYGMTETAPMITFPRPHCVKLGTTGQALPGIEIKIENEEILVRGKAVMKGYYRKEKETTEAFQDGWLKTGDLGTLDQQGFLKITGRSKELIILSNGKNISPVEIEMKLDGLLNAQGFAAKELAVMAKKDLLHALFVFDEKLVSSEDLKKDLNTKIIVPYNEKNPSYKQIRSFEIIAKPLPRTRLEKLKRHELGSLLSEIHQKKNNEEKTPIFEELNFIKEILEKETGSSLSVTQSFSGEIPLDSLSRVSLFASIKDNFNYEINEDTLLTHDTPLKLALFLKEKSELKRKEETNWKQILTSSIDLKLPKTWPTFNLFKNISYYFFKLYFRLKGQGLENIPTQGPCVFAVSHQSFLDGLFVSFFLKNRIMKNTYFYAKSAHIKNSLFRFLAATNNIIVVNKELDLKLSIQKMAQAIRLKKNIIIFPEGTRSYDGKLGELKKTFAILAKELQVPIIPVQIQGAFKALPRGKVIPRPFVNIKVSFKEALWPDNFAYDELVKLTEERLLKTE